MPGVRRNAHILSVRDLCVTFPTPRGDVKAVREVCFSLRPGEIVGLVGESGSGKSAACLAIGGLLPKAARVEGYAHVSGHRTIGASPSELGRLRGSHLAYIFQDPIGSLNPIRTVGWQIREAIARHKGHAAATDAAVAGMLALVSIPDPERCQSAYPHELSGGMCQRIGIAMALAGDPALIIADEPTTALDATVQAQILDLLIELREARRFALLLVTHDLSVVAQYCDRVLVMYAGRIIEDAPVIPFFDGPSHPYSRALLAAIPHADCGVELMTIEGVVPDPKRDVPGCDFAPRCPQAEDRCRRERPSLSVVQPHHTARCLQLGVTP